MLNYFLDASADSGKGLCSQRIQLVSIRPENLIPPSVVLIKRCLALKTCSNIFAAT
jgi:hypothetical protein